MSGSLVGRLVLKDLYLMRWIVLASLGSGAVAVGVLPLGGASAYVGGVSLICILVILNIFVVMTSVVQERKDKVLLFTLSLPVSTTQYTTAKILANGLGFVVPWFVLTAATFLVVDISALPNGILPFWLTVLAYLLGYFCVLLAVALVSDSTGWHATAIIIGNVSVNFLIPFVLGLPSVVQHGKGPTAVWTGDIVAIVATELVVGAAALGVAIYVRSRVSDYV